VDSVHWRDHLDKSGGQTNSRPATSTGMTALATLKNLFRCIRLSLRLLEETIMAHQFTQRIYHFLGPAVRHVHRKLPGHIQASVYSGDPKDHQAEA
jgi:hypothetical protein